MDESRRYQAWGAIAGGALMLVGSFLPWITITTIFGTLSRSGVDGNGDGLFSAGLGILAAAIGVALLRNESRAGSLALVVLGALGGLLVYVDATDIQGRLGDLGSDAALGSVGIGLWVVGAGAALVAVMGIEGVRPKRRQPDVEASPAVPEPAALDEKRSPKATLKPPDHGIYRCVSGAKIPEHLQNAGQTCPFCARTLSLTPNVKDNTTRRPLPLWQVALIIAALAVAGILLYFNTDLGDALGL